MNRDDLLKFMVETHTTLIETTKRKNSDYAGKGGENPFANFERVEAMGICSTEKGFLCRMTDKMSRISSLVDSGDQQVKDESVTDTLLDLANYSILLMAYIKSKGTTEQEASVEHPESETFTSEHGSQFIVHRVKPTTDSRYDKCFVHDQYPETVWNYTKGEYEFRVKGFDYGC